MLSSLIFTEINRSVIPAAYYMCNKYFRDLFKTPPWRPGVYSKSGVKSSKYSIFSQAKIAELEKFIIPFTFRHCIPVVIIMISPLICNLYIPNIDHNLLL